MEGHQPGRGGPVRALTHWLFRREPKIIDYIAIAVIGGLFLTFLGWAGHQIFSGGGKATANPPVVTNSASRQANQSSTSSSSTTSTSTTSTTQTKPATPRPKPRYLISLTPTGGDEPQTGDIQLAGRDFRHSLWYPDPFAIPSTASGCETLSIPCRATSYDLPPGYREFTATVGVNEDADNIPGQWQWYVVLDGQVKRQGSVPSFTSRPVDVQLGSARILELRLSDTSADSGPDQTYVWGDARVQ